MLSVTNGHLLSSAVRIPFSIYNRHKQTVGLIHYTQIIIDLGAGRSHNTGRHLPAPMPLRYAGYPNDRVSVTEGGLVFCDLVGSNCFDCVNTTGGGLSHNRCVAGPVHHERLGSPRRRPAPSLLAQDRRNHKLLPVGDRQRTAAAPGSLARIARQAHYAPI